MKCGWTHNRKSDMTTFIAHHAISFPLFPIFCPLSPPILCLTDLISNTFLQSLQRDLGFLSPPLLRGLKVCLSSLEQATRALSLLGDEKGVKINTVIFLISEVTAASLLTVGRRAEGRGWSSWMNESCVLHALLLLLVLLLLMAKLLLAEYKAEVS